MTHSHTTRNCHILWTKNLDGLTAFASERPFTSRQVACYQSVFVIGKRLYLETWLIGDLLPNSDVISALLVDWRILVFTLLLVWNLIKLDNFSRANAIHWISIVFYISNNQTGSDRLCISTSNSASICRACNLAECAIANCKLRLRWWN